jgi:hypothetical protein
MARFQVQMAEKTSRYGEIAVDILNKQSLIAEKWWSSGLWVGITNS